MKKHITIIEDDADIARLLRMELEEAGFDVATHDTGVQGLMAVREDPPDLLILDLGLPDLDGAEIARRVRKTGDLPILILTAADEVRTKVDLLNAGADDYLAKPFHMEELVARVNVQLRKRSSGTVHEVGDLRVDVLGRQAFLGDEELKLSPREFDLLVHLVSQPGRVFSREEIESSLWSEGVPSSNVVDVHVANIRGKLRDAGGFGLIRTVRGVGYALKE